MKKILFIAICLCIQNLIAQPTSIFMSDKSSDLIEIQPEWKRNNKLGIDVSEVTFVNWNSGGSNSVSALFNYESHLNYSDKYFTWKNSLVSRYGINKQQDRELRKTEDIIEFNSNLGYQPDSLSNWFYSARLNFKTQFTNGYSYPDTDKPISRLMAPGYLFFGGGMEYVKRKEEMSLYLSPMTIKTTFVLDQELANAGSFGVKPAVLDAEGNVIIEGNKIHKEVGVLVTNSYEKELVENITLKHLVSLYTDYINSFGNVDVDWQINFDFKVNSFVKATLGSHIRYDDDVKTTKPSEIEGEFDEAGAKTQWKQFLGIGFAVDF
jgi:hypothetical protein